MLKEITLDNYTFNYQVFFKNNKHMYLRIKQGVLQITCPKKISSSKVEAFIKKNKDWIIKHINQKKFNLYDQEKMYLWGHSYPVNIDNTADKRMTFNQEELMIRHFDTNQIERFYHLHLKHEIDAILNENQALLSTYFDLSNLVFKTQLMRSRLGSCHVKKGIVKMNTILARVDKRFTKLVLFHELVHLVHQNHSKAFHDLLEKIYPNHRLTNRELTQIIRQFNHAKGPMTA